MSEELVLTLRHRPEASCYEALVGALRAEADYVRSGDVFTFTHVGVPPVIEGRGVGGRLVQFALDDVRAQGGRVIPRCPFVRAWIRRNPSYADLLADERDPGPSKR
jgi:predicted GNAT family acetyltransferase